MVVIVSLMIYQINVSYSCLSNFFYFDQIIGPLKQGFPFEDDIVNFINGSLIISENYQNQNAFCLFK